MWLLLFLSSSIFGVSGHSVKTGMTIPSAVACSSFDAEPSIAVVFGELFPRPFSTTLYEAISEYKAFSVILEFAATHKAPIQSTFSVGLYNITISPSVNFLYEPSSAIQLIQRQNKISSWLCRTWRNYTKLGDDVVYEALCGCPTGETVVDNTGDILCIIHPCSSIDWNNGWCAVEVDLLKSSCIHSNGLARGDVSFQVYLTLATPLQGIRVLVALLFLICESGVVLIIFTAALGLLTIQFMRNAFLSYGDSTMEICQYIQYLQSFVKSLGEGRCPREVFVVLLAIIFGGIFFRDDVSPHFHQSTDIILTRCVIRFIGLALILYSMVDAGSMVASFAIFVSAAIARFYYKKKSTNENRQVVLLDKRAYDVALKNNTVIALSKLRKDLEASHNLFDKSFSLISVAGKPKLAHLLKCFKDGSFSGIPYISADDTSSKRKSWRVVLSTFTCLFICLTAWVVYCEISASDVYGVL